MNHRRSLALAPFLTGVLALGVSLLTVAPSPATALDGIRLPCGAPPLPSYPEPGAPPAVAVWADSEHWSPPDCSGWTGRGFRTLVVVAGAFRLDGGGGVDDLLARFGAVSTLPGVRFWSASDRGWRPLVDTAAALGGPPERGGTTRPDFSPAEMKSGAELFFAQAGGRTGEIVNRMRVREARPDRLVITAENATPVKLSFLTLFGPSDLQTLYVLERQAPGIWNYYGATRVGRGASSMVAGREASFVNRAVALYRHFAGLPTDRDPPSRS